VNSYCRFVLTRILIHLFKKSYSRITNHLLKKNHASRSISVHLGHTHTCVCVCAARVGVLCFECVLRVTDGYVIRDIRDTSVTVPRGIRVEWVYRAAWRMRDASVTHRLAHAPYTCVTHPSRITLHMRLTHASRIHHALPYTPAFTRLLLHVFSSYMLLVHPWHIRRISVTHPSRIRHASPSKGKPMRRRQSTLAQ
jgi:hypothetical protein